MARCRVCHTRYDPDDPADAARHRRLHDRVTRGLPRRPLAGERVLWQGDGLRVTVVVPAAPRAQRRRVEEIARIGAREMGYTGSPYSLREPPELRTHGFLGYRGARLAGVFLLAHRRVEAVAEWVEGEEPDGVAPRKGWRVREPGEGTAWSVDFLWVAPRYRRTGLGRRILTEAARYLGVPLPDLAWYPPFTAVGRRFIPAVSGPTFRVAR
ncbi:GNAT family N-acetyltransferase [Deferrisoma camini]|uniref:GNAT family N-acetyltransferase n=1 Tax=Deferrisoma camini TaxID=1035120 RepID=UPI00046CC0A3|nr:GNAT family N-acetyltransferase [Deferrisoma camini]